MSRRSHAVVWLASFFLVLMLGSRPASCVPPAEKELGDLDGSNGFVVNGISAGDRSGFALSGAGDVNGDGFDDVIIGARGADPGGRSDAGQSYVVFGGPGGFPAALDLASLDGSNGFAVNGIAAGSESGCSVSGVGDVNGDGFDDVVIGALGGSPNGKTRAGQSYVIYGGPGSFPAEREASTLNGTDGFVINGIGPYDYAGSSVAGAGDVNGDGTSDIVIGAPLAGGLSAGESYVVFGSSSGFPASFELWSLNGTNGFRLRGIQDTDHAGTSVSGAGDVNGDGVDDVIIGAPSAVTAPYPAPGESYVVFGSTGAFPPAISLSTLNGSRGFVMEGVGVFDGCGSSVSAAGDVNGDGVGDVIVGALWADANGNQDSGQSYVVFGHTGSFPAGLSLSSLNGTNGFALNGIDPDDSAGAVSGVGDVNGDGLDDLIVGAGFAGPNGKSYSGQSYVVFGSLGGFPAVFDLAGLRDTDGFALNGVDAFDHSGLRVGRAGDVDGDGVNDFLIGAPYASPAGESYLVLGDPCPPIKLTPRALPNGVVGADYRERITALGGVPQYSFTTTSGPLPPGLQLSTDGRLFGIPTATGSFQFVVTAVDMLSCPGSRSFTIVVVGWYQPDGGDADATSTAR